MSLHLPPSPLGRQFIKEGRPFRINEPGKVRHVTVADLAEVEEHRVNRILGSTSHVIRFARGGLLCYAYDHRGEVFELTAERVEVTVTPDNDFVFSALRLGHC